MDSFYQMNTMQMMQDESNLVTDEQASKAYVTFGNGNDDEPNEFDHISILDNKPNIGATKGLSDPRHTFFRDQCFRMLRVGNCNAKFPSKCNFQHQVSVCFCFEYFFSSMKVYIQRARGSFELFLDGRDERLCLHPCEYKCDRNLTDKYIEFFSAINLECLWRNSFYRV